MSKAEEAQRLFGHSIMAGPMVRGSSHVFRMTCLRYGADVVFSPALNDLSLIASERREENGHTVLYANSNGHNSVVFRTCAEEKSHLVIQLMAKDGPTAATALKKVEDLASGIDLNCGCPEHFAVHRGCGSSLEIESAVDIVKTLTRETSLPVSVKFRVESELESSLQFAKAMENAGASMITVHGRLKADKHKGPVDYDKMKQIFEAVTIPTTGNGGVTSLVEAEHMRQKTGCNSVMICSAALKNPSVFSSTSATAAQSLAEMTTIGKLHNIPFRECRWSFQQIVTSTKALSRIAGESLNQADSWESMDSIIATLC